MENRQLRYYVAIVDFGSLTKAAAHMGVAQPALSHQLSQLEAEYNAKLLIRSSTGVKPTELGIKLYKHARVILRQIEEAREDIQTGVTGHTGIVNIGLPTTVALPLGYPLLKAIRQRFPRIRLHIFESLSGYLLELLENCRLDFAVLFREGSSKNILAKPLVYERVCLLGNCGIDQKFIDQNTCSLVDVESVPLVLPGHSHELRILLEHAFAKAGVRTNVVADVDSLSIMIAAAREGLACTILPASTLLNYDAAREVAVRQIVSPEIGRTISLCRANSSYCSPASQVVEDIIYEIVPELIREGKWPGVRAQDVGDI